MRRFGLLALALSSIVAGPYLQDGTTDPIAKVERSVQDGSVNLEFEPGHGYLKSLLKELKIDPASQVLVYSKSSLQSDFISPKTPRALYFNEHTYVGWIPGAPLIEVMTVNPKAGATFYTIKNTLKPVSFSRDSSDCNRCHGGGQDLPPALLARSTPTGPSGYTRPFDRTVNVTPRTPLNERWGGWYVSGTHGDQRHLGNELSIGSDEKHVTDTEKGANVVDLRRYIDIKPYLTPHSDIVALLVLEQQMDVQNRLTRAGNRVRGILRSEGLSEDVLPEGNALARVQAACEPLVEALLCVGEVKLTSPISGTSAFADHYAASGRRDSRGRSLNDLDLDTRLLKYPCSSLVYSESFDALPGAAKLMIGQRFGQILGADTATSSYENLTPADRKALLEILRETKPGLKL